MLGTEPSGTKGWIQFYFPSSFQLLFTCLLGRGFVDHMPGADTVRWLFCCDWCFSIFIFSLQVPTASRWKSTRKWSSKSVWGSEVGTGGRKEVDRSRPTILSGANQSCLFYIIEWEKQHKIECSRVQNPKTAHVFFRFRFRGQKCDLNGKKNGVFYFDTVREDLTRGMP